MSIFSQIIEGLANLDEGYARDKRQASREEKSDMRRDKSETARDVRLNKMTLMRDKLLASEQAVRDARLHGNAMDVQKAQIDADRAKYEYQNAQESIRQDKDIGFKREDNKEQRLYGTSEREAGQEWRTGERKGAEKFQGRESKKDRRNRLKSIEATANANVRSEDQIAGNRERRADRKLASVFPDGMNPAERETAVRDLNRTLSYDLPLAEARGRIKTIDDTEGGALFPGYYGYRGKQKPGGAGDPFGTTPDAGNTGINIKDLYE